MDSHQRRMERRKWRREHGEDIQQIITYLKSTPVFEFKYIGPDGILEMCERPLQRLGMQRTRKQWRSFLLEKEISLETV